MIGISEPDEIGDHHQQPVGDRTIRIVAPAYGEPGNDGEERQRHGVHFLIHDALIPYREGGCAEQRRGHGRDHARPAHGRPRGQDTLRHQEPERRRQGTARRCQCVDAHRHRSQRHERRHAPEQHEERIARRMRNAQGIRGGDVLARVPHCRGGRECREVEREYAEPDQRRDTVRRQWRGRCVGLHRHVRITAGTSTA